MGPEKDKKEVKGLEGMAYGEQLKIFGLLSFERRRARGDLVSCFWLPAGFSHDASLLPAASSRGGAEEELLSPRWWQDARGWLRAVSGEVQTGYEQGWVGRHWSSLPGEAVTAPSRWVFQQLADDALRHV